MHRILLVLSLLPASLAACAQAPGATAAAGAPTEEATMAERPEPVPAAGGGIEGSIREGNRPPPALRVCARPVAGGEEACVETVAGATRYRLALRPGRYVVTAEAVGEPDRVFAHASRIRCVRPPCPPDTLRVVEVGEGVTVGVDLSPGGARPPRA